MDRGEKSSLYFMISAPRERIYITNAKDAKEKILNFELLKPQYFPLGKL